LRGKGNLKRTLFFALVLVVLTGCGGGSDGGSDINGTWRVALLYTDDPCGYAARSGTKVGSVATLGAVINESNNTVTIRWESGFVVAGTRTGNTLSYNYSVPTWSHEFTGTIESSTLIHGRQIDKALVDRGCFVAYDLTFEKVSPDILF